LLYFITKLTIHLQKIREITLTLVGNSKLQLLPLTDRVTASLIKVVKGKKIVIIDRTSILLLGKDIGVGGEGV
jgi:hypothetical protein